MLFDTDILIWVQRGNYKAAKWVDDCNERLISVYTYMELLQCALNKTQHMIIRKLLKDFNFRVISLNENIGHRAAIYIEEYSLNNSMRAGDAIIAATAVEENQILLTSNKKHFKQIPSLQLQFFKP